MDFKTLFNGYSIDRVGGACGSFENQCAIRMSGALRKAGMNLEDYKMGPVCKDDDSEDRTRGAQSLADYLEKKWGKPQIRKSSDAAKTMVKGKTGVIFFKDAVGTIDHIDLWDGEKTKKGEYFEAKEIWFWEMK